MVGNADPLGGLAHIERGGHGSDPEPVLGAEG